MFYLRFFYWPGGGGGSGNFRSKKILIEPTFDHEIKWKHGNFLFSPYNVHAAHIIIVQIKRFLVSWPFSLELSKILSIHSLSSEVDIPILLFSDIGVLCVKNTIGEDPSTTERSLLSTNRSSQSKWPQILFPRQNFILQRATSLFLRLRQLWSTRSDLTSQVPQPTMLNHV